MAVIIYLVQLFATACFDCHIADYIPLPTNIRNRNEYVIVARRKPGVLYFDIVPVGTNDFRGLYISVDPYLPEDSDVVNATLECAQDRIIDPPPFHMELCNHGKWYRQANDARVTTTFPLGCGGAKWGKGKCTIGLDFPPTRASEASMMTYPYMRVRLHIMEKVGGESASWTQCVFLRQTFRIGDQYIYLPSSVDYSSE